MQSPRRLLLTLCSVLFLLLQAFAVCEAGTQEDERRVRSGLRLFRTMLAADEDLAGKVDRNGEHVVLLVYSGNRGDAQNYAEELQGMGGGMLLNRRLRVEITNDLDFSAYRDRSLAGFYLVQPVFTAELHRIIRFADEKGVIFYSPFSGDVEKGAHAGLVIETRVLPYLNPRALAAARIRLKPFFLKVAKHHEP